MYSQNLKNLFLGPLRHNPNKQQIRACNRVYNLPNALIRHPSGCLPPRESKKNWKIISENFKRQIFPFRRWNTLSVLFSHVIHLYEWFRPDRTRGRV